ncbi:MAG: hypothetical protein H6624_00175 [Bdellovibrionaceae bacterium]|nr:hypothetical protein [Bdellovibrionales bacterium]MCB9082722.1 hypothetical protein [Pseudobdellovibrionaceae bacterium]
MSGTFRCLMIAGILFSSFPVMGLDFDREIARQEVVTVRVVETLHQDRGRIRQARHIKRKFRQQSNDYKVTLIPKKRTRKSSF